MRGRDAPGLPVNIQCGRFLIGTISSKRVISDALWDGQCPSDNLIRAIIQGPSFPPIYQTELCRSMLAQFSIVPSSVARVRRQCRIIVEIETATYSELMIALHYVYSYSNYIIYRVLRKGWNRHSKPSSIIGTVKFKVLQSSYILNYSKNKHFKKQQNCPDIKKLISSN